MRVTIRVAVRATIVLAAYLRGRAITDVAKPVLRFRVSIRLSVNACVSLSVRVSVRVTARCSISASR